MKGKDINQRLAKEAKAIVALAFRNGPIESIHAGRKCPTCYGRVGYSRISQEEMKMIMKNAVDQVYRFGVMKESDIARYEKLIAYGNEIATHWDDPDSTKCGTQ